MWFLVMLSLVNGFNPAPTVIAIPFVSYEACANAAHGLQDKMSSFPLWYCINQETGQVF